MLKPTFFVFTALLGVALGCGDSEPETTTPSSIRRDGIVNGRGSTQLGIGTLVRISLSGVVSTCTGTVVGARSVLTAAHCVEPMGDGSIYGFWEGSYRYSSNIDALNAVVKVTRHPEYLDKEGPSAPSADFVIAGETLNLHTTRTDLAVVHVAAKFVSPPATLAAEEPAVGSTLTLFGAGVTDTGRDDGEVLRTAINTLDGFALQNLYFIGATGLEGNVCSGDSGGPSFVTVGGQPRLVGVHSTGTCSLHLRTGSGAYEDVALGVDANVAANLAWIREQIALEPKGDSRPTVQVDSQILAPQQRYELNFRIDSALGVRSVRVTMDGLLVSQNSYRWSDTPPSAQRVQLSLSPGRAHRVVIEVRDLNQAQGTAEATVTYGGGGGPQAFAPASNQSEFDDRGGCQSVPTTTAQLGVLALLFWAVRRKRGQPNA